MVTAGPTREYLDPVRFITNESSGKMGYAIAGTLYRHGVDVIMISGPVSIKPPIPAEKIIHVVSAEEMLEACSQYFKIVDAVIFTAAVADYRPASWSGQKIKKTAQVQRLEFVKNPDIAYEFGKLKKEDQISVGFALETDDIIDNAAKKLEKKNFDAIVINSPNKEEGFGYDTNRIAIMRKDRTLKNFPLKPKKDIALDILKELETLWTHNILQPGSDPFPLEAGPGCHGDK